MNDILGGWLENVRQAYLLLESISSLKNISTKFEKLNSIQQKTNFRKIAKVKNSKWVLNEQVDLGLRNFEKEKAIGNMPGETVHKLGYIRIQTREVSSFVIIQEQEEGNTHNGLHFLGPRLIQNLDDLIKTSPVKNNIQGNEKLNQDWQYSRAENISNFMTRKSYSNKSKIGESICDKSFKRLSEQSHCSLNFEENNNWNSSARMEGMFTRPAFESSQNSTRSGVLGGEFWSYQEMEGTWKPTQQEGENEKELKIHTEQIRETRLDEIPE